MRVLQVDPSAFTPPYDRALSAALAARGAEVTLATSRFELATPPPAPGVRVDEGAFYRWSPGRPGSRVRLAAKLAQHVPDMVRLSRRPADVVHFQWLAVQPVDGALLPRARPVVLTAHDVLPREPRPGQRAAQRRLLRRVDAVVVHSAHGRARLVDVLGVPADRVEVIPHGAFTHLAAQPPASPLPPEVAAADPEVPVVLLPGLLRPYKGVDVLLEAARGLDAEVWIAGRPRMDLGPLHAAAPPGTRWVPRFVTDPELAALLRRATLVVLPYREIDQSGVLFAALGLGAPLVLSDAGGFPEVAATGAAELVPRDDPAALHAALAALLADPAARARLAAAARREAATTHAWDAIAGRHLDLYARLA